MDEGEELVAATVNGATNATEFVNNVLGELGMPKLPERPTNGSTRPKEVKEWVKVPAPETDKPEREPQKVDLSHMTREQLEESWRTLNDKRCKEAAENMNWLHRYKTLEKQKNQRIAELEARVAELEAIVQQYEADEDAENKRIYEGIKNGTVEVIDSQTGEPITNLKFPEPDQDHLQDEHPECPDLAPVSGGSGTPEPLAKEETPTEIVPTSERCTTLEAQVKELTAKYHQALNTITAIAATCEENSVDTEALRHENALLREKVMPLQAVIDAYPKSPKHTLVKQNIELQAEKAVALQDVERLTDRVEELEGILCTKDDRIEELEQEHAAKDERIQLLEALLRQNNIAVPA
jgi:chromosome segregation ATPase